MVSFPRADHNNFSPLNLSLGMQATLAVLPLRSRPDTPQVEGGLGFYIAETAYFTCALGLRVSYENNLYTEVLPSTMTFSLIGAARSVCTEQP